MAALVEFSYNPFDLQLSVLINGQHPSDFSSIIQYVDEDIWKWHSFILDVLYEELRDDFYFRFVGMKMDALLMQWHCSNHEHCVGFEYCEFQINDSLQKRLGLLNQYLKKSSVVRFDRTIIESTFFVPQNMQEYVEVINEIDICNLFCSARVQTTIGKSDCFQDAANAFLFVLAKDVQEGERLSNRYHSTNPIFVIIVGTKYRIVKATEKIIMLEVEEVDLINGIFDCFLFLPLLYAFQNCYRSLLANQERSDKALKRIVATESVISFEVNNRVEVGKSNVINVTFDPPIDNKPKIIFKVLNEHVAITDGMCILGKNPGTTRIAAYVQGNSKPFQENYIDVYRRNRIKKLIFDEDEVLLGSGDTHRLTYEYFPPDADNVSTVQWKSSDTSIIQVDSKGILQCKKPGKCRVICTAENVSATCMCEVKPYLEKIEVVLQDGGQNITMEPMQEINLEIKLIPSNCIDGHIEIISSDYNVVNVIGKKLIAKNVGHAEIQVRNSTKRKTVICSVDVIKKRGGFLKSFLKL